MEEVKNSNVAKTKKFSIRDSLAYAAGDVGCNMSFAFPVTMGLCLIVSALVTLLRYIKKGRLYIFGGALILFGLELYLVEFLLNITFNIKFIGWSYYTLIVLSLLGGLLIYLGINTSLRKVFERKLFF